MIIYAGDTLQSLLPPALRVRVDERVILEEETNGSRVIRPDVYVIEHPETIPAAKEVEGAVSVEEEPLVLTPQRDTYTESYIEIVDEDSGDRVITAIEFLSPANKLPGKNRTKYRRKQRDVIRAGASLVEIDLTRTGRYTLAIDESQVPPSHRTTYRACTWRGKPECCFEFYRIPLLRRLPTIRIPLRPTDDDARLELQPLVDRALEMGRYRDLDYRGEPNPLLNAEDAKLADEWLKSKGFR
jgi:hypothetical protein